MKCHNLHKDYLELNITSAIMMANLSRDPKYLHKLVMQDLQEPVVFHSLIENWDARVWTPDYLASVLGDKEIKMRIGLKAAKEWGK